MREPQRKKNNFVAIGIEPGSTVSQAGILPNELSRLHTDYVYDYSKLYSYKRKTVENARNSSKHIPNYAWLALPSSFTVLRRFRDCMVHVQQQPH